MIKHLQKWMLYFLTSAIIGGIVGFLLLCIWFLFSWIFLGYGDSGPSWINTVNEVFFWGAVCLAIIFGQILFVKNNRKEIDR